MLPEGKKVPLEEVMPAQGPERCKEVRGGGHFKQECWGFEIWGP
jgi:hypothetical protein